MVLLPSHLSDEEASTNGPLDTRDLVTRSDPEVLNDIRGEQHAARGGRGGSVETDVTIGSAHDTDDSRLVREGRGSRRRT